MYQIVKAGHMKKKSHLLHTTQQKNILIKRNI